MEEVRKSIDKCLEQSEKRLMNVILDFIHPNSDWYVKQCPRCGCIDTCYGIKRICKVCHQREDVILDLNTSFTQINMFGEVDGLSPKITKYLVEILTIKEWEAIRDMLSE